VTAPATQRPRETAATLRLLAKDADCQAEEDGELEPAFLKLALTVAIHHRDVVALDNVRIVFALWATDGIAHAWARLHSEIDHAAMTLDWAEQ
jgi:hypothetical protein